MLIASTHWILLTVLNPAWLSMTILKSSWSMKLEMSLPFGLPEVRSFARQGTSTAVLPLNPQPSTLFGTKSLHWQRQRFLHRAFDDDRSFLFIPRVSGRNVEHCLAES
jgi:hypothetical protein